MTQVSPSTERPIETQKRGLDARWRDWWSWLLLVVVTFPALMLAKPGWITADTKAYLYLNPWKLIVSSQSMWNPDVNMGTVTHEQIGYLFPTGPFYWLVQSVGMPMWIGERLWFTALFVAAGGGVLYVGKILGLSPLGRFVSAMMYMLSPFLLDYIGRSSVLLTPWAGFGWLVGFTILASRRGGWRYPALFAIVVAAVSGINATAILFAGLGPVAFLLFSVFLKEATWRQVWSAAWRIALLTAVVSLWWVAGLWAEAAYGLNILKFTETIPTVMMTSSPSEIFRGLGYWYFYGWDRIDPWVTAGSQYIAHVFPILVSFSIPALAVLFGFFTKWRYRAFAIFLVAVGVVLAVSAFPFNAPTPFGLFLKAADQTTIGLAMRSTNRVLPLVILGLALLLGAGLSSVIATRRWVGLSATVIVVLLIMYNMFPLFGGSMIPSNLSFPNTLPSYVTQTANYLNSTSPSTRVLGVPGIGFGYYRWGVTMDQVWPGLLTRPWIGRGAQPQGEAASVNLLRALDQSIQDDVIDPHSIAPMASLMSAGDILFQGDFQYERFSGLRGQAIWNQLQPTPAGLGTPKSFGPPISMNTLIGMINDEQQLATPNTSSPAPSLAVFPVSHPRDVVRTEPLTSPLLVAGDGEGLLEAASFNLFGRSTPIFYSASFPTANELANVDSASSTLAVTDSNLKRLDTCGTLDSTYGFVETVAQNMLATDPAQQSIAMFPPSNSATQTVAVLSGVKSVEATSYGNPINNSPEYQPFSAIDGNPNTAWVEGALQPATGEALQITELQEIMTNHIRVLQPQMVNQNRTITTVSLTFDGKDSTSVTLNSTSLTQPGQLITFPTKTFQTLKITVTGVTGSTTYFSGLSGVGFAEVKVGDLPPATESLRMPTDLLNKLGTQSSSHDLVLLMHRIRTSGLFPRSDVEPTLRRTVTLPTARSFGLIGEARISNSTSDPTINRLVGRTTSTQFPAGSTGRIPITQSNSSSRLSQDLNASSWAAEDGNSSTSWQSSFVNPAGQWLEFNLAQPTTFSTLDLQIVNDGRHSVPTNVTITSGGSSRTVALPSMAIAKGKPQGAVQSVPIAFAPLTGDSVRMTINTAITLSKNQITIDGGTPPPVGVGELGIPNVVEPLTPSTIPENCTKDILAVNSSALATSVQGESAAALNRQPVTISTCSSNPESIPFSVGSNSIVSGNGTTTGWDIDLLKMTSPRASGTTSGSGQATPSVHVTKMTQWSTDATLKGTGHASWLVLGQSLSSGWHATLNGKSLGEPTLIDGYANGWKIPAIPVGATEHVSFVWTPQHVVNIAEIISLLGLLAALLLALWPVRKSLVKRERSDDETPRFVNPLFYEGANRTLRTSLVAGLIVGVVVGIFTIPLDGLLAFALTVIGLRNHKARVLMLFGSVGGLALAGLSTAWQQHSSIYPWNLSWPLHFGLANVASWVALGVLLVDGVVEVVRSRQYGGAVVPDETKSPESSTSA